MTAYFLALIGGQLFAVDKERVVGVGTRDESKVKPLEDEGRKFLPLANSDMALIWDLLPHMPLQKGQPRCTHYLLVRQQGLFMALPMLGKGRLVQADDTARQSLPPAFTGMDRRLIHSVLVNCRDIILMLDLDTLAEVSDETATATASFQGMEA